MMNPTVSELLAVVAAAPPPAEPDGEEQAAAPASVTAASAAIALTLPDLFLDLILGRRNPIDGS
jgi:hypothetical protein